MITKGIRVLIVDDEQCICDLLHDYLTERGYLCSAVLTGHDALAQLESQEFEVILLDLRLPGLSGMKVLREARSHYGNTVIIIVTAVNDIDTAVEAMKLGASDYVVKPFELDRVDVSIRAALETKSTNRPFTYMEHIARGVEAGLDAEVGYSKMLVQRTIHVASKLGISDEKIQSWVAVKARLDSERSRLIKTLLSKTG